MHHPLYSLDEEAPQQTISTVSRPLFRLRLDNAIIFSHIHAISIHICDVAKAKKKKNLNNECMSTKCR